MGRKRKRPTVELMHAPAEDGVGVFAVVQRKTTQLYTFREIPCDIGGRGFAVHRTGLSDVYHVRVGEPEECSCECLGFLRHGNCKHIRGLLLLLESHLLERTDLTR